MRFRDAWLRLSLAILLTGCSGTPNTQLMDRVREVEQQFAGAKRPDEFLKVAGTYERLLGDHPNNPGLLYNQGNAFFQAGQKAKAIACYRRALRYWPRDENLRANLLVAAGPNAFAKSSTFERIFFWQNELSSREVLASFVVLATLTFALGLVRFVRPRWLWVRPTLAVFAILTMCAGASAGYNVRRYEYLRHGITASENAFARSGPGENYPKEFPVPFGVEFEILESRLGTSIGNLIRLPDGKSGWIGEVVEY